jgi:N-acetylmuramoyl-L-alanine amidase
LRRSQILEVMTRIFFGIVAFVLIAQGQLFGGGVEYAVAKVKKGETVEKFLKRYQLTPHECNIDEFTDINNLSSSKKIYSGKIYKLPLKIMNFDGKSIRSSCGIADFGQAKNIEKFNTKLLKKGVRTIHYTENNKIWVPYTEYDCKKVGEKEAAKSSSKAKPKAKQVDSDADDNDKAGTDDDDEKLNTTNRTSLKRTGVSTINVPLMGSGYDVVNIEDFTLKGQVYYVIAGHGGPDPGAVGTRDGHDLCEDEYAYDVALRVARDLMQHGATVHMIVQDENDGIRDGAYLSCDKDENSLGKYKIPLSQKTRLRDRAALVNKLYNKYKKKGVKIQKSIEIHVDSRSQNVRQDAFFYYNDADPKSKKLATDIQNVFESKYNEHQKDRGYQGYVESRNIYMVKNLLPTTVFVELANIRNVNDQQRLLINSNRQALANWLFEGLRKE